MVAFLIAGQFLWSMETTGKDLPSKVVGHFRIFLFQFLDESIHFCASQKVYDFLFVVDAELFEVFLARAVDGEHNLVHRILVTHETHASTGILRLVDVHLNDIAEDTEVRTKVFWLNLCDVERALTLRQARYVSIENVEQGASCRSLPSLVVEHDKHLVWTSASLRKELFLLATN